MATYHVAKYEERDGIERFYAASISDDLLSPEAVTDARHPDGLFEETELRARIVALGFASGTLDAAFEQARAEFAKRAGPSNERVMGSR
jgi:hypothetical protein